MFRKRTSILISYFLFIIFQLICCDNTFQQKNVDKKVDYIKEIPGRNDSIPASIIDKGKVLIAYSDCYTCHKDNQRWVGPAFTDIAKRYPVNKSLIELLARKVITGGSGSWGHPVMSPHPKLSVEDAKMMVTYILSLEM